MPVCPSGTDAAAGASSPVRLAEDCPAYFALFCRARSSHSGPPDPGWALSVPCALGYMFLSARTRGHRGHSIACKVGLHAVAACDPCLAFPLPVCNRLSLTECLLQAMVTPQSLPSEDDEDRLPSGGPSADGARTRELKTVSGPPVPWRTEPEECCHRTGAARPAAPGVCPERAGGAERRSAGIGGKLVLAPGRLMARRCC